MEWLVRRHRRLAIVLLCTLLIANVPARVMTWVLPQQVVLSGLSGTLWSGQAVRSWITVDQKPVMLGRIQWRISPWRLVWSTPLQLSAEWGDQLLQTKLGVSPNGQWQLRDSTVTFELDALGAFLPLYLGGTATAEFDLIQFSSKRVAEARGRVTLQDTVWTATSGNILLGSYYLDIGRTTQVAQLPESDSFAASRTNADSIEGVVRTEDGALILNGAIGLSSNSYDVDLTATGPVARDEGFRRAVSILATPTAAGFDVLISGQL